MEPYLPGPILWRRKKMGFTFPYRSYFSAHADVFGPFLSSFQKCDLPFGGPYTYQDLLTRDPVKLWRLLSTAIWFAGRKNKCL